MGYFSAIALDYDLPRESNTCTVLLLCTSYSQEEDGLEPNTADIQHSNSRIQYDSAPRGHISATMTIEADYIAASQALGATRYSVSRAYQSIPETKGLEWTDGFFQDEVEGNGLVAVFDFDYAQMVDFNTKTAALGQISTVGCLAAYGVFLGGPLGLIAPAAYTFATMWPCFLRPQVEWAQHSQHVAITRDGIRFVQDQRKSCWGLSVCDKGRHSKTVPFDKITDCDICEPAGSVCLCIPRVLLTVNVDTASSGGEGKRYELKLVGLKEAHKFKQLVWAMKRAMRDSSNGGNSISTKNAYLAPQSLEMTERYSSSPPSVGDGGKVEFLLRDIRDELRANNQLLKEIKEEKKNPLYQQRQIDGAQDGAATLSARVTATLQAHKDQNRPEIV